jgi:GT2 family glycosyltransferase
MAGHPEVTVASPPVLNRDGTPQAHCSAFPTWSATLLSVLGIRPSHYAVPVGELRASGAVRVPCIAGCVMFCRGDWLRGTGGFDPRYLFFGEDADLCRRCLAEDGQVAVIDAGSIVHLGGASTDAVSGKRGGLLVNAIVTYNRKWHSEVAARLAWAAYVFYFGTRFIAFRAKAILGRSAARERAERTGRVFRLIASAPAGEARVDLG